MGKLERMPTRRRNVSPDLADAEQLGIFLCMRCGALHRKLGTHISKVKSLSMDKWDHAQVEARSSHPCRA
jgi:hypothetical protein